MSFVPEFIPASAANLQAVAAPYVSGRWYPVAGETIGGGGAAATGTLRMLPFLLRQPVTISDLGARVSTTGAGSFQIGIYANNPATMRPTGTVLARTGDILTTAAAAVSADITGANVFLPAGIYWSAVNVDATSAAAGFAVTPAISAFAGSIVGSATLASVVASTTNACLTLTTPMAYNSWDDITGATFTESAAASAALVFIKAA